MAGVGGSPQQATLNPGLNVPEIYDSITLEYNGKSEKVGKLFSTKNSQIQSLELQVATLEEHFDDCEQERLLDSLFFVFFFNETGPRS